VSIDLDTPPYIVGIDLGTTNSVVSYARLVQDPTQPPEIAVFDIPQLTAAGVVETRRLLPSALLLPGPGDVPEGALSLPWPSPPGLAVGEYARDRGAEIPQRSITSAKSWLCHKLVDRNAPILPWEGPDDRSKLSPVEASGRILTHIRDAWNARMAQGQPGFLLERQDILLTVPASFDAVARDLTVRAAELAGLSRITLIEEPTAAFYAWIASAGDRWRRMVHPGDSILVCDIGGGTSDFSLIQVAQDGGRLSLERIAVGDHLLVGGDNMDLALAHRIGAKLAAAGTRLDSWQMRALWRSCRGAKERMLAEPDLDGLPIAVLGRGSGLIGGTVRAELAREDVESVLLDGFLPRCGRSARPETPQATGIRELGLAYEADPAITRHLARFIDRRPEAADGPGAFPTAVLFNGGVMKAAGLRHRILDVLSDWQAPGAGSAVRELTSNDFDLAVARGAVYYGLARRGNGIRIRAGLPRNYYIGIAAAMPAVPGLPAQTKALCVAPFGLEEGQSLALKDKTFALVVGEPVRFDFLSCLNRPDDRAGEIVEDWEGVIEPLTALETHLDGEAGQVVPITLEVRATEIGTLEIWCVAAEGTGRWKLEFSVRERSEAAS